MTTDSNADAHADSHIRPAYGNPLQKTDAHLKPGMYVRVPVDTHDTPIPGEHRDFSLGQVLSVTDDSVQVNIIEPYDEHRLRRLPALEVPLAFVHRCAIAEHGRFIHRDNRKWGRILAPCQSDFTQGEYHTYYVELGEVVCTVSEAELYVPFTEGSPDPIQQMRQYELHPPRWRARRDSLVESYAMLQAATFGMEELVGTRISLLAHQAEVVARVLGDRTCRYMLADEVGLGKTIEACVILKGLRRRLPRLKALIVVPAALLRQWHNELNDKFWLDFHIDISQPEAALLESVPGLLISHETLTTDASLWDWLTQQQWGLLIVDEVHNLHRQRRLYNRVVALSKDAERALMLSATPVERRAKEYLALLKLMHPEHYGKISAADFDRMLAAQSQIRSTVAYLTRALNPTDFDAEEFYQEMQPIQSALDHDRTLHGLLENMSPTAHERGPDAAREVLQYISENYRIESRVIRNRRVNLQIQLPVRQVTTEYAYRPEIAESETLLALTEYAAACLSASRKGAAEIVYCQLLFHAAFSSPDALVNLLALRQATLSASKRPSRQASVADKTSEIKPFTEEQTLLARLLWRTERWQEQTKATLTSLPNGVVPPNLPHRLVQVLRAIHQAIGRPGVKVLVFSAWKASLDALYMKLTRTYGRQAVARFLTGLDGQELQSEVDRFQADDKCRIMLTDESGGEGRNFQIADQVVHVDLPWTPARVEQRIGRVDRLGRTGTVLSIVPFARGTLEEDLFRLWHDAFRLFEQSMSGLEIVLEDIQDKIGNAFAQSPTEGLADLLAEMKRSAKRLREQVEEERYFEEGSIDYRRRSEFEQIAERYRDGELLREALLEWANMAGLYHHYNPHTRIAVFDPKEFSIKSIENAKFAQPPNMQEALRRSRREHNLVLKGTFDRDLAVRREDIIFFAPGELWTDAVLANALRTDRGRCTAILRAASELSETWHGFEFFFRITIDPRALYAEGHNPVHLLRAQGYLGVSTYRTYVSTVGEIVKPSSPIGRILRRPFDNREDYHLGKRSGSPSPLLQLKQLYTPQGWQDAITTSLRAADTQLRHELTHTVELSQEANAAYQQSAAGQRAAHRWLFGDSVPLPQEISEYESISQALVQGLACPRWQLESICFWVLRPAVSND